MSAPRGKIVKAWAFKSETDSSRTYQTLLYDSGATSCDCLGWTKRAQRTCRHVRWVELGLADECASAIVDYKHEIHRPAPVLLPAHEAQVVVRNVRRIRYE